MKDNPATIKFHKRATVALDMLSLEQKNAVLKSIDYLANFGLESILGKNVKPLNIDESLYLLRVGRGRGLRLLFRLNTQNEIEILDIFMSGRLEVFAHSKT